jgi:hypothetical protein
VQITHEKYFRTDFHMQIGDEKHSRTKFHMQIENEKHPLPEFHVLFMYEMHVKFFFQALPEVNLQNHEIYNKLFSYEKPFLF